MSLKNILLSIFLLLFMACNQDLASTEVLNETIPDTVNTNVELISQGQFMDQNGYEVSGNVMLFFDSESDTYTIAFENLLSDNGPDLHVYLSSDASASSFVDLGSLKSVNGNQTYTIDAANFPMGNNFVHVWCKVIDEAFGQALLQ